jgi:hypothetical protein
LLRLAHATGEERRTAYIVRTHLISDLQDRTITVYCAAVNPIAVCGVENPVTVYNASSIAVGGADNPITVSGAGNPVTVCGTENRFSLYGTWTTPYHRVRHESHHRIRSRCVLFRTELGGGGSSETLAMSKRKT